jgi:hypothetical protein
MAVVILTACNNASVTQIPASTAEQKATPTILLEKPTPMYAVSATSTVTPRSVTRTPRPTPSPSRTPRPTATLDATKYFNVWSTYTNSDFGFSFEYPALYDDPILFHCRPTINQGNPNTIYLGVHVEITVLENADQVGLSWYVAQLFGERADWQLQQQTDTTVAGRPAIHVVYQYGASYRVSEIHFVAHQERVYAIQLGWGIGSCDNILYDDDIPHDDWPLYAHVLETFQFLEP